MSGSVSHRRRLIGLFVFAVAMGWLEAVVVVYLRGLLAIARSEGIPPADEVMRRIATLPWLLSTEQSREIATLIMLAAVAWLSARWWRARFGAFLFCFGVWDIGYYGALHALLRWPRSILAMDLLFLVPPHPWWYQPIWIPIGISGLFIWIGARLFGSEGSPALRYEP